MKGSAARVRANPWKRPDSRFKVLRQRQPPNALKNARAGSERVQPKQARFEEFLIVELIEPRRGRGIVIDRGFHELRYGERGRRTLERTAVRRGGAPSGLIVPIKLGACRLVLASLSVPRAAVKS